jgi:thioredoxin 1
MRNLTLILFCFLAFRGMATENTKVRFYKGDIASIREVAKSQGKLYVLDFVAPWCLPCKIMDETTYNDENLADFISNHYVVGKVNIEDFDGFALKDKYNIKTLPTLLVFNQAGEIVASHEGSLTASKMLRTLEDCHAKTPVETLAIAQKQVVFVEKSNKILEKTIFNAPVSNRTNVTITPKSDPAPMPKKTSVAYNIGVGIYKLDIARNPTKGFSIQIHVLTQYDNVIKQYEEAKLRYEKQPILLQVDNLNNKTSYKLLIGCFQNRAEAEKYKKTKNINGYVKDLSLMR